MKPQSQKPNKSSSSSSSSSSSLSSSGKVSVVKSSKIGHANTKSSATHVSKSTLSKKKINLKNEQLLASLDGGFTSLQDKLCGAQVTKLRKQLNKSTSSDDANLNNSMMGDSNSASSSSVNPTPTLQDVNALRSQHKETWNDMVSALSAL